MFEVKVSAMNLYILCPSMVASNGKCVVHRWIETELHAPTEFTAILIRQD